MITKIILGVVGIEILMMVVFYRMLGYGICTASIPPSCTYIPHPIFFIVALLLFATVLGTVIYWVIKKIKQHKEAV